MEGHYSYIFYETVALRVPLGVVVVAEGLCVAVRTFQDTELRQRLKDIRATLDIFDFNADHVARSLRSLRTRLERVRSKAELTDFHRKEAGVVRVGAPLGIIIGSPRGNDVPAAAVAMDAELLLLEASKGDAWSRLKKKSVADKILAPGVTRPGTPVWKPCLAGAGRYEVSSCGEVRGARSLKMYRVHSSRTGDYVELIDIRGKKRACRLAPLILQAFGHKRPSPKHQIEHRNGDPRDHHVTNLAWKEPA